MRCSTFTATNTPEGCLQATHAALAARPQNLVGGRRTSRRRERKERQEKREEGSMERREDGRMERRAEDEKG